MAAQPAVAADAGLQVLPSTVLARGVTFEQPSPPPARLNGNPLDGFQSSRFGFLISMARLTLLTTLALVLALVGCDAIDEPRVHSVSGRVLSADSRTPLEGVPVLLSYYVPIFDGQSGPVATGVTDADGRFTVSGRSWERDLTLSVNVNTEEAEALPEYESFRADVRRGWNEEVVLEPRP